MTIEAGALALRITEVGADQVLAKLTQIDAKARALGQVTLFNARSATGVAGQVQQITRAQMQLGQAVAATTTATNAHTQAAQRGARAMANLGGAVGTGAIAYQNLGRTKQQTTSLTNQLTAALGRQVAAYFTFRSVVGVYNLVAGAADRQDAAQRRLNATARLTGVALSTITDISKGAQDRFAISSSAAADLTQAFVKLAARSGDVSKAGPLMNAWMDLAAAQGLTLSDVLTGVNTTLVGQDEGLNRLGLMNPSNIWKQWADAAGTTVGKMTEQQKWQSIVNAVTQEGAKVQGEYGKSLDTTAGKQQQFTAQLELTAAAYGKSIAGAREWAFETGAAFLRLLRVIHESSNTKAFGILGMMFSGGFTGSGVAGLAGAMALEPKSPFNDVKFESTVSEKGQKLPLTPAEIAALKAAAKKAEEERQKSIADTIDWLVKLSAAEKLTTADMARKIDIERQLTAEEQKRGLSGERRAAIAEQLAALSGVGSLKLTTADIVAIDKTRGRIPAPSVGIGPDGKMAIPFPAGFPGGELPMDKEVERQLLDLEKEKSQLALGVGESIGSSLAAGFSAAFSGEQNFFEAFGKALLSSIGNILIQLGGTMIAYGAIVTPLLGLPGPFAALGLGAAASLAAGTALIALGAGMAALGGGGRKGSSAEGGGGGRGISAIPPRQGSQDNPFTLGLDPDRKLGRASGAVMPSARALGSGPMPNAPQPVVVNATFLGDPTPQASRWVARASRMANGVGVSSTRSRSTV